MCQVRPLPWQNSYRRKYGKQFQFSWLLKNETTNDRRCLPVPDRYIDWMWNRRFLDEWRPFPPPIKPYIEYWNRAVTTPEARGQDSANCGGGSGDDPPGFGPRRIKEARRSGETENETYRRLFHDWERCMLKTGYRFTGPCYDNEISRASPACGAP